MRVLFTTSAARPHLYPIVPLAWACRAAGHEVRVASGAKIADDIVHTGLPAVVSAGMPAKPRRVSWRRCTHRTRGPRSGRSTSTCSTTGNANTWSAWRTR
ncbi:hypothetical protein GCM10029964_098610 [Kibdelosporangium lantanae]